MLINPIPGKWVLINSQTLHNKNLLAPIWEKKDQMLRRFPKRKLTQDLLDKLIGEPEELLPQLKTKVNADHVGLLLLQLPTNRIKFKLDTRPTKLIWANSNWSIAQQYLHMEIKDVMEDMELERSNILKISDRPPKMPILTRLLIKHALLEMDNLRPMESPN